MKRQSERRPMVFSRVEQEDLERFQEVADRLYDGNLSLLVRKALKEFVDRHPDEKREVAA